MLLVLLVVLPVGFLMSTAVAAALIGFLLKDDVEKNNAGSELLSTNY